MDKPANTVDKLDFPTILASALHDMKNSLSIFLSMLEDLVNEMQEKDPHYGRLVSLQYEGKRMGRDMTQLLGIYRSSNAQLAPNIIEVDIADFLAEQVLVHEVMLAHKKIVAEVECSPGVIWFFDQEMVAGILTNIINNAYKYTRSRLLLQGEQRDGGLLLSIKDDGPGYPADMMLDSQTELPPVDFKSGSTGLGLYFASLVAGLHKNKGRVGYVRVNNDGINGGGCFCLWLP